MELVLPMIFRAWEGMDGEEEEEKEEEEEEEGELVTPEEMR